MTTTNNNDDNKSPQVRGPTLSTDGVVTAQPGELIRPSTGTTYVYAPETVRRQHFPATTMRPRQNAVMEFMVEGRNLWRQRMITRFKPVIDHIPILSRVLSFCQYMYVANTEYVLDDEHMEPLLAWDGGTFTPGPINPPDSGFAFRLSHSIHEQMKELYASRVGTPERLMEIVMNITSYANGLLNCETPAAYTASTLQFITGVAGGAIAERICNRWNFAKVQADSSVFDQLLAFVRNSNTLSAAFYESPTFLFFKDAVGVAALSGLCINIGNNELARASRMFAEHAASTVKGDLFGTILRAFEFALEVSRDFTNGQPLSRYVMGKGVMSFASELLAKFDDFSRGMLLKVHGYSDATYLSMLQRAEIDLDLFCRRKAGQEQAVGLNMKQRIQQAIATVKANITTAGYRMRPFGVLLYGKSAVGKSNITPKIISQFGATFGIAVEKENISQVNETEKYDGIDGKTTVIIFDDMCNSKMKEGTSPTDRLIRYNNVTPAKAIKADVVDKDVIPIEPELIIATTNIVHLNVSQNTNEPASVFNRFNVALEVRPKVWCRKATGAIDSDAAEARKPECPHEVSEITYAVADDKSVTITYGPWICYDRYKRVIMQKAEEHREQQRAGMRRFQEQQSAEYCSVCFDFASACTCPKGPTKCSAQKKSDRLVSVQQLDEVETQGITRAACAIVRRFYPPAAQVDVGLSVARLIATTSSLTAETNLMTYFFSNMFTEAITEVVWAMIDQYELLFIAYVVTMIVVISYTTPFLAIAYFGLTCYTAYAVLYNTHRVGIGLINDRLIETYRDGLTAVTANILDYIFFAPPIALAFIALKRFLMGVTTLSQGNLQPNSMVDVNERVEAPNEWFVKPGSVQAQFLAHNTTKTMTHDDMCTKVRHSTYHCRAPALTPGKDVCCLALKVYSDYVILPNHSYTLMDTTKIALFSHEPNGGDLHIPTVNGQYEGRFFVESAKMVGKDHVCVRILGMPKNGDIRKLFPTEIVPGDSCVRIVLPASRPQPRLAATYAKEIRTDVAKISGFCGTTAGVTIKGDCGAAWVGKCIIGIHNGRTVDTNIVVCESILRGELDDLPLPVEVDVQGTEIKVHTPPPLTKLETVCYSEDICTGVDIHERSCVNFPRLHDDGRWPIVDVYGSANNLRATAFSTVTPTPISLALENVGIPQKWGQPKMRPDRNFATAYQDAQHTMRPVSIEALNWAVADYLHTMYEKIDELGYHFQPLSDDEALNGRKVFGQHIKPMNMQTSPGIGLAGSKKDHMESTVQSDGSVTYAMKGYVKEELDRIETLLYSGQRSCPISKGCLKDEPTKINSEKVRVFFAMPMAFLIAGRKLSAPVLALLMSIPLDSEQWYGVRVTTEEWHECYSHLAEISTDSLFNGDYSGYDRRLSSQLLLAVGDIFAGLATRMGYSPEDAAALATWFSDVANPIYAYNGTLVSFDGFGPSGSSVTVAKNGVGNGTAHRCFFYERWLEVYKVPPEVGSFRKHAHFGFVGDDSIGSVSPKIPWFNMRAYQKWCTQQGLIYTGADKSADIELYVPLETASLCKRTFRPVLVDQATNKNCLIVHSPIETDSLMKSLHCFHSKQSDPWLIIRNNLISACRELGRHPEPVFNMYLTKIRAAMILVPDAPTIPELDKPYSFWQADIAQRYSGDAEPMEISIMATLQDLAGLDWW